MLPTLEVLWLGKFNMEPFNVLYSKGGRGTIKCLKGPGSVTSMLNKFYCRVHALTSGSAITYPS